MSCLYQTKSFICGLGSVDVKLEYMSQDIIIHTSLHVMLRYYLPEGSDWG